MTDVAAPAQTMSLATLIAAILAGETHEHPTRDEGGRPIKFVDLDNELLLGGLKVTRLMLRKPMGGDLRGVKMNDVYNADVVAIATVVSRISEPAVSAQRFMELPGEDIGSIAGEVVNFLLTRRQKAEAGLPA